MEMNDDEKRNDGACMPNGTDDRQMSGNDTHYVQDMLRKGVGSAEQKLNAMSLNNRKKWLLIVLGAMLLLTVFNFVRSFCGEHEELSVAQMYSDSILGGIENDVKSLSVMNLDSLSEVVGEDSSSNNFYFK